MNDALFKPLLAVLNGDRQSVPPVWLMRQAGRYLPEYRELRKAKGSFLDLCYDPEAAAEVTLQPIRRFGFDGAILFSDILVIPHALGQDLWFEEGEGPRLAPPLVDGFLAGLEAVPERLNPIYETIRRVKAELPPSTTFLGFAGSPWTIATYMVAGQGSKDHHGARSLAYRDPEAFGVLIDAIVNATVDYLAKQLDAGVEAVQLFDSWAGSLSPSQFERWVIAPNAAIVAELRKRVPSAKIIGFPKGAGAKLLDYVTGTGVDAIGLDETIDPVWANSVLPANFPVQGNLDPMVLLAGGPALEEAVHSVLSAFCERPHILNLGHGIVPQVPLAHVERLVELMKVRAGP